MTDSVHPTIDELADLQEGLLDESAAEALRVHLAQCDGCAADLARLSDVQALLSTAGGEAIEMPPDVVARIDDALAAEASGTPSTVSSMATARTEHTVSRKRRPWLQIMAGAAAVLVFAAFGIEGWQSMNSGSDSDDSSSSGDAGAGSALTESQDAPQDNSAKSGGDQIAPEAAPRPEVTRDSLPTFARQLANGKRSRLVADGAFDPPQCATALAKGRPGTTGAAVRWADRRAVVIVDPDGRTATVFGCGTGAPQLYSTSY